MEEKLSPQEQQQLVDKVKKNLKTAKIVFIIANTFAAITFGIIAYLLKNWIFLVFSAVMLVANVFLVKFINRYEQKILNFETQQKI